MDNNIVINIPDDKLIEKARKHANQDWLASFQRDIVCDCAINHTPYQMMSVIAGLDAQLKSVKGMENLGEKMAHCIKPFIHGLVKNTKQDRICALFDLDKDGVSCVQAESIELQKDLEDAIRNIKNSHQDIDNYETIYYKCLVLVNYSQKKKIFDFYYAYVYSRNTSVWQWALSSADKKKRIASLEAESIHALGCELSNHSGGRVTIMPTRTGFENIYIALE